MPQAVARSMTKIAHLLGLMVVAKFVESAGIQQAFEEVGVDIMQNYLSLACPEALQ